MPIAVIAPRATKVYIGHASCRCERAEIIYALIVPIFGVLALAYSDLS